MLLQSMYGEGLMISDRERIALAGTAMMVSELAKVSIDDFSVMQLIRNTPFVIQGKKCDEKGGLNVTVTADDFTVEKVLNTTIFEFGLSVMLGEVYESVKSMQIFREQIEGVG